MKTHKINISKLYLFSKKNILLLLIVLLAAGIYLTNLGGQSYALDEPQTVAIARTILTYGYPSGWDGISFLSAVNGTDFTVINGNNYWTWHPWLQFYLIAPFISLFGLSLSALRFPFALLGVVTICLFYLIVFEIFKKKWIAFLLAIQLLFLLPFFLYIREIRYYSPAALFSVILFWFLFRLLQGEKSKVFYIKFSMVSMLLFATNYIIWLSCLIPFGLYAFRFKNKPIFLIVCFEIVIAYLWFHFFSPFAGHPTSAYGGQPRELISTIFKYLSYSNNYIFPFLFAPFLFYFAWKNHTFGYLIFILLWLAEKIVLYAIFLDPHGRYLVDCMPIFLLLYGFIYLSLWQKKQKITIGIIFFVSLMTNIFSLLPNYFIHPHENQFRYYPQDFSIELTKTYPSSFTELGNYMKMHAKLHDSFWSNNYSWNIYIASGVPLVSTVCDMQTQKLMGPKTITDYRHVKWFIFFQYDTRITQTLTKIPCMGKSWQTYMEKNYTKKVFSIKADSYIVNDPDIFNRHFPPGKIAPDTIILFEKK